MLYDFKKIKIEDINGKEIKQKIPLNEMIGKLLYTQCHHNFDLVEVAKKIHAGKEVELDKVEIEDVKKILLGKQSFSDAFVKKYIKDYIDEVKKKK